MTLAAPATLPRPRDATGTFGLYVHVPFCAHRCWYCDFNAYAGLEALAPSYMRALADDVRHAPAMRGERPEVTSVFVGGGTPSLVDACDLVAVLDAIRDAWPVASDVEVTVECNPESTDAAKLEAYAAAGVNRVSFGVQSLRDGLLQRLGRLHDARTATAAIALARGAGFDRVNADLIVGIPGESDADVRLAVEGALAAGATHVSCYGLTYEEGTPLESWKRLGKVVPEPDDDVARRWELADAILRGAGLERYEISNWAPPGESCRHNDVYWACGEYLGLGAGAHSHVADEHGSVRSWTVKAPARYVEAVARGEAATAGSERVDAAGRASEVMFLGLRRAVGVSGADFRALTGAGLEDTFGPQIDQGVAAGLLERVEDVVRLTRRGTLLANEALVAFLEA